MTAALKTDVSEKLIETLKLDGSHTFSVSRQAMISMVSGLIAYYPDPDSDAPLGPWGPIVRKARALAMMYDPQPLPWRAAALNPQPLPPRAAFAVALAEEVAERAVLIGAGDKAGNSGSTYIDEFVDFWCLTPPRPHKRHPTELLIVGTTFLRLAEESGGNEGVRRSLVTGGERMLTTAVAQLN
jgi:hypothetical protein